ncbi:MAG: hypothetical protein OEZ29_10020, partial [Candidatus Bathyarchaeota archaeon]|nr:hypothetical protein [Candidatus Bathyarchaeota archaeon]
RSMEIGALAVGGIPPLSGFWCTNWIQTVAWDFAGEAGSRGQFWLMASGYLIFALLIIGAGVTAFYGLRMMGLVFGKNIHRSEEKIAKKPSSLMHISLAATLVITAFLDFLALLLIWPFNRFLLPMPFLGQPTFNNVATVLVYIVPSISTVLTGVAVAFGGYPAYKIYIARKADAGRLTEKYWFLKTGHKLLRNRFHFDKVYYKVAHITRFLSQKIYNSLEYGLNTLNDFIASRFLSLARTTHKYVETEGIAKPQIRGFSKFYEMISGRVVSLSHWAYPHLELGGFEALNYKFAKAVAYLSNKIRKTHTGVLSYNMLAISIGIAVMVILLIEFGGIL